MAKEYIITADSKPDLDEWGWDDYWSINDWIEWHKKMKKEYGRDKANRTFIKWWEKQTTGAAPLDARSFDTNFRNYAKKNGFFDALYGGMGLLKVLGAGSDVLGGATEAASQVAKAGVTVAKMAKWVIPVVLITLLVGGAALLYKEYKK